MVRLRDSWRTSLSAPQQPRNPQPESIARKPYDMRELPGAIPGVEVLLALEPEELGAKLLFLIRERLQREANFLASLGHRLRPVPLDGTQAGRMRLHGPPLRGTARACLTWWLC